MVDLGMVDSALIRRLALGLPEAAEESAGDRLGFSVAGKAFAWTYLERIAANKPRRPRPDVLAVRCPLPRKEMLIEAAPEAFFEDEHYLGYPAVLVRLAAVDEAQIEALLRDAWRLQAPKRLQKGAAG
jgi:hypothetical protein